MCNIWAILIPLIFGLRSSALGDFAAPGLSNTTIILDDIYPNWYIEVFQPDRSLSTFIAHPEWEMGGQIWCYGDWPHKSQFYGYDTEDNYTEESYDLLGGEHYEIFNSVEFMDWGVSCFSHAPLNFFSAKSPPPSSPGGLPLPPIHNFLKTISHPTNHYHTARPPRRKLFRKRDVDDASRREARRRQLVDSLSNLTYTSSLTNTTHHIHERRENENKNKCCRPTLDCYNHVKNAKHKWLNDYDRVIALREDWNKAVCCLFEWWRITPDCLEPDEDLPVRWEKPPRCSNGYTDYAFETF